MLRFDHDHESCDNQDTPNYGLLVLDPLFYRDITGYYRYIETISIDNNNIYFTDIYSGKEYFVPLELLSLPVEEAKEKYADILKNEEKSKIEKERRKVESDIENYKNLLQESEEKLEKLKAEEGNLKK